MPICKKPWDVECQVIKFLASGFYSGYLPKAPGTWGTIVALPLILFFDDIHANLMIISGFIFLMGWGVSQRLTNNPESDPDPSYIVIDEIAGMFFTMALLMYFNIITSITYLNIFVAFVLFRIFDILKPMPINLIDRQCAKYMNLRGFGVMIDDILAGLYAAISFLILVKIKLYMI